MKILDVENVQIPSLNKKFINKNFITSQEYRDFKKIIFYSVKKPAEKVVPPYAIRIIVWCYTDKDNVLKPIYDALELAGVIDNDRNVLDSHITKVPIKRGSLGSLKVWLEHYEPNYFYY